MPRLRRQAASAASILSPLLTLALAAGCASESPAARAASCSVQAADGLRIESRRCRIEPTPGGGWMADWAGYAENLGPAPLVALDLAVIAFGGGGSELGRDRIAAVGFSSRLGWLPPGFGIQLESHSRSVYREPPARIEIRATRREVHSGGDAPTFRRMPIEATWERPLPPGDRLELFDLGCGAGLAGIGPGDGRVAFDCTVGVANAGGGAVAPPDLAIHFHDAGGAEVDRLGLTQPGSLPLAPRDTAIYTGARAVQPHVRFRLHASARAAPDSRR